MPNDVPSRRPHEESEIVRQTSKFRGGTWDMMQKYPESGLRLAYSLGIS